MTERAPCFFDILKNLFDLPDAKPLVSEHVAERASIMGTPQGRLYQQTIGFYPGAVYFSFVVHISILDLESC